MMKKIEAHDRYLNFTGALKTFYLFSFADYYDPANLHFGALRVFNDDTIAGEAGFPDHAHDNMEIVTIVLDGELTHKDSMGNRGVIRAGEVQRMSAGTVVVHSEINESPRPVHLFQIWIIPHTRGLKPSYEQKDFNGLVIENGLTALASGSGEVGALMISAHATIYRGRLLSGVQFLYAAPEGYGVFIYIMRGAVRVNGALLTVFEQARITDEPTFEFIGEEDAEFVMIAVQL